MRATMFGLSCASLLLAGGSLLGQGDGKGAAVRELDVKGVKLNVKFGDVAKPTAISSGEELDKLVDNEAVQARLKKQIDFTKEKALLFAWQGSGGDKLTAQASEAKGKTEVHFLYKAGFTDDLRSHIHLFVIPRDAAWQLKR